MGKFDLSKSVDTVRAIGGDARGVFGAAANVLSNFLGNDVTDWDIEESSYQGGGANSKTVIFHIFKSQSEFQGAVDQIQDTGGRRKVKYQFPYQDGQTTDDLGRKPETFSINILMFGARYKIGFKELFKQLNDPVPGTLIHPVRGPITCGMEDYTIIHKSDTRKAMIIQLTMIEHNFSVSDIDKIKPDNSVKSALSKALGIFQAINSALLKIEAAAIFVRSVKNDIEELITTYQTNYARTLARLNKTYNENGDTDIPAAVPFNEGGLIATDGSFVSDTFTTVTSPTDSLSSIPTELLSPSLSIAVSTIELEKEVNDRRTEASAIVSSLAQTDESSLEFYQEILDFKVSAVILQDILEKGKKSSRTSIISYITPRLMTIREAGFANGISIDRVEELEILNPELESFNYIAKGTELKIPV